MDTPKKPNKMIIAAIVIVLLVAASAAVIAIGEANNTNTTQTNDTNSSETKTADTSASGTNNATANSGNYKDGTYSANGSYRTPGGNESIGLKVTIANGVISDATVTQNASGGEAAEYQEKFASAFKSEVVGKKINEVSLSRVAGSSLTPLGFNNAIDTIKSEAQS